MKEGEGVCILESGENPFHAAETVGLPLLA